MIVELILAGGIGKEGGVLRVDAAQVLLRQDNGTAFCVAFHYGPDKAYAVAHAADKDFNRLLGLCGHRETVIANTLQLPGPPPGAVLLPSSEDRHGKVTHV